MTEAPTESIAQEIEFDPQAIASVLRAQAERPSDKMVREGLELGFDLAREIVREIFLFDSIRRVEGYLMLYPDRRLVTFHSRVLASGTEDGLTLNSVSMGNISKITTNATFGWVEFQNENTKLRIYHDCQNSVVSNVNND